MIFNSLLFFRLYRYFITVGAVLFSVSLNAHAYPIVTVRNTHEVDKLFRIEAQITDRDGTFSKTWAITVPAQSYVVFDTDQAGKEFATGCTIHVTKVWTADEARKPCLPQTDTARASAGAAGHAYAPAPSATDLLLEEFTELFILQKDYHLKKQSPGGREFLARIARFNADFEASEEALTALPHTPYVLFKPKHPKEGNPLIVHSHGGPHVRIDVNTPHAEIRFFLAQGYTVACPNYKGSTYPTKDDSFSWDQWYGQPVSFRPAAPEPLRPSDRVLKDWLQTPQEEIPEAASLDVYSVAEHLKTQLKTEFIFLRGGSFGSAVNSKVLAKVKSGEFKNIFTGAHLSGGLLYPPSSAIPGDTPLLITHGLRDRTTDPEDAQDFMENVLNSQPKAEEPLHIQTFLARRGNHHLIDPTLAIDQKDSPSYSEVKKFLRYTWQFIDQLASGKRPSFPPAHEQISQLFDASGKTLELKAANKAKALAHITHHLALQRHPRKALSPSASHRPVVALAPSMALLKLALGTDYSGNPREDLGQFLRDHFKPMEWEKPGTGIIASAGQDILKDGALFDQLVQMIEEEQRFLAEHPDYLVLYHSAPSPALQIYAFISLWKAALAGYPRMHLESVTEMRLFDFVSSSYSSIEPFLRKMRTQKPTSAEDPIFNNLRGFAERALSVNPSLISNSQSTAASSLWWYFHNSATAREVPTENIIESFLKVMGIYKPQRLQRYQQLFTEYEQAWTTAGIKQNLMQQIFVRKDLARSQSYVCELWGVEFKKNRLELQSPDVLDRLRSEPERFEAELREHKDIFSNPGDLETFGDLSQGFFYAGALQLRYLNQPSWMTADRVQIKSYVRDQSQFDLFVSQLADRVREDYAEYLASSMVLPESFSVGAEAVTKQTRQELGLPPGREYTDASLLELQKQLLGGLVENPDHKIYGQYFAGLDKERILSFQEELRDLKIFSRQRLNLYSVTRYVRGYTYFSLIEEAARKAYLSSARTAGPQSTPNRTRYERLMSYFQQFSHPQSIHREDISGPQYEEFKRLLSGAFAKFEFNPAEHQLFETDELGRQIVTSTAFAMDVDLAQATLLTYARLAKERGYDHDLTKIPAYKEIFDILE